MPKHTLGVQLALIAGCIIVVALQATNFPFPSPLIQPLLPPKLRWPPEQVLGWIEAQNYPPGFLEYFSRDPERVTPPGPNVVSPADGVVVFVPERNGVTYFTVDLSFWDVHVVRAPVAGVVTDVTQEGFTYFRDVNAAEVYLRGKDAPVQQIVTLDTPYGEVRVRLITSYWATRLKVWVHRGDRLEKGARLGRILLGSSVVAEFQGQVKFEVKSDQHVVGGETVIFSGEQLK